jgi:hypothetical protein
MTLHCRGFSPQSGNGDGADHPHNKHAGGSEIP